MSGTTTRRSFIGVAGAALSAPLTAAGTALAKATPSIDDVAAIRSLVQAYARHVNAGRFEQAAALFSQPTVTVQECGDEVRWIDADGFGERDSITVAAGGQTATARFHWRLRWERAIGADCPLVEMARLQGGGVTRRTERGVFACSCVKRDGVWTLWRGTYMGEDGNPA